MSKYPCLRPAGMSDEEDDEDDDVFYSLEEVRLTGACKILGAFQQRHR